METLSQLGDLIAANTELVFHTFIMIISFS